MTDARIQYQVVGIGTTQNNQFGDAKLNEDTYELYVNNELIGHKTLLNQVDSLKDVDDFIIRQGIKEFSSELEGDHYNIQANHDVAIQIRDILNVYCNNR